MDYPLPPDERPFSIDHFHLPAGANSFTPASRIHVRAALRTRRLLSSLSDEHARTLLAVLTYVSPNGSVRVTIPQIAAALGISRITAMRRIYRLCGAKGPAGAPVRIVSGGVETRFSLSPAWVSEVVHAVQEEAPPTPPPVASREAVIEHSRTTYGRARDEVEQMIEKQLGHSPREKEDTLEGEVRRGLSVLGIGLDEAERLLSEHALEDIRQQLVWIRMRGAKKPGRYLVAAIEGNYGPPLSVRKAMKEDQEQESDGGMND